MYDVIIVGSGISGATFASKISKFAKTLVIEANAEDHLFKNTNIFPEHNRPYFGEIDWADKTVFPTLHERMKYIGTEKEAIVESSDFGAPLGNVTYYEELVKKLLQNCQDNGGTVAFNEKVSKINKTSNQVEVLTNTGKNYNGKLLVLATGSHDFSLQNSLGFESPDRYMGVFMHLYGDEDKLNENVGANYMFHINTDISKNGPFYINKGKERMGIGFLGNRDNPNQLVSKLNRILDNYKRIKPYIEGLKREEKPTVVQVSKHPIKIFSQDRALILGEASGLITAFFYEGVGTGVICADTAARILKPLIEENSSFSQTELAKYDDEIKRILLNKYFRNGNASEYIFYKSTSSQMKILWDTYVDLVRNNKTLRSHIYDAYCTHDLPNYDTSRDRWIGERLLAKLPLVTKISMAPRFLRAAFK